jgi:voltage-gated potassium channel
MMLPLLIGSLMVVVTVLMQGVGSLWVLRFLMSRRAKAGSIFRRYHALVTISLTALALVLLHWLQIMLWAALYLILTPVTPIATVETALYLSAITFTTVGYGDITLQAEQWRLLCGIEGLNGVLLLGWSTALLYAVVHRTWDAYCRTGDQSAS